MKRKQPGCKGFDLDYEAISREYLAGEELKNLANKYNVSIWTLLARFKKIGVKKNTERYLDKKSFSIFMPESCYWAGFLGADGCIRNYSVGCQLAIIDKNHLEKLKLFLQSNADIKQRDKLSFNKPNSSCSIEFNSIELVRDLEENFNIIRKKSLILKPPYKIPNDLVRHYIRGYVDGDGSIGWHKHNSKPRLSICSGSKDMLEWIGCAIKSQVPEIGFPKTAKRENSNLYTIEYVGKQVGLILDWLYNDTNEAVRLDRKYNRYIEYIAKMNSLQKEQTAKQQNMIQEMIDLYKQGMSYREVAETLEITSEKVAYYMKSTSIAKRNKKTESRAGQKLKIRDQEMLSAYLSGETADSLALKFGICKSSVWAALSRTKQTNGISKNK